MTDERPFQHLSTLTLIEMIDNLRTEIRMDWSDPRDQTREIGEICVELRLRLELKPDAGSGP